MIEKNNITVIPLYLIKSNFNGSKMFSSMDVQDVFNYMIFQLQIFPGMLHIKCDLHVKEKKLTMPDITFNNYSKNWLKGEFAVVPTNKICGRSLS